MACTRSWKRCRANDSRYNVHIIPEIIEELLTAIAGGHADAHGKHTHKCAVKARSFVTCCNRLQIIDDAFGGSHAGLDLQIPIKNRKYIDFAVKDILHSIVLNSVLSVDIK